MSIKIGGTYKIKHSKECIHIIDINEDKYTVIGYMRTPDNRSTHLLCKVELEGILVGDEINHTGDNMKEGDLINIILKNSEVEFYSSFQGIKNRIGTVATVYENELVVDLISYGKDSNGNKCYFIEWGVKIKLLDIESIKILGGKMMKNINV